MIKMKRMRELNDPSQIAIAIPAVFVILIIAIAVIIDIIEQKWVLTVMFGILLVMIIATSIKWIKNNTSCQHKQK